MAKLLQIGITGGIGSGKSLICKIFGILGVPIYDADSRARWLMSNNPLLVAQVKEAFGDDAYLENGEVNRPYLAQKVFHDGEQVKLLNSLVHPKVGEDSAEWSQSWKGKVPYVLREAALMFESGSYKHLDRNITVYASIDTRIQRVLKRDPHRGEEQIRAIIGKQMSEEKRQELADYVIKNDASELVIPQVLKLHEEFIELSQQSID